MRVKLQDVREGLHPKEMVATIDTITGPEELIVDAQSALRNSVEVGNPVAQNGRYFLIELPSETSSGSWRVWVDKDTV